MKTVSYLMSVTSLKQDVEVLIAIQNIAGRGHILYGSSTEFAIRNLWIIPKGNKNSKAIISRLNEMPAIRNVSIVTLSKQIKETELAEVRKLFAYFNWDTSSITDNELFLFINEKIQGKYTSFIDCNHKKTGKESVEIRIKPIEEHPDFSVEWLTKNTQSKPKLTDRELTIDDIEFQTMSLSPRRYRGTKNK
jgi:hypothetical protein